MGRGCGCSEMPGAPSVRGEAAKGVTIMLIKKRRQSDVLPSEITPESIYRDRRRFLRTSALAAAGTLLAPGWTVAKPMEDLAPLGDLPTSGFSTGEEKNTLEQITTYNNFYEFGTDKEDPMRLAPERLAHRPWTLTVSGEAENTGEFAFDDFMKGLTLEERIYRLRCVEAWSMVIPWAGVPLAEVIRRANPNSRAKYVKFYTKHDPEVFPAQRARGMSFLASIDWPYTEGLRMDEAMNPLTLLATGLYGREMPSQNGAPIRLVVPWKYGFKSIKSVVRIHFQETEPECTWNQLAPREYGFYANVNPDVDHPRWSQARERRIGELFKQDTLMFNGYGEEVADLYAGMDLRKNF